MSNQPQDPAAGSVDQSKNHESSLDSQEGYGVEYQNQRFNENMQQPPAQGRSGSYEATNTGGYGNSQPPESGAGSAAGTPAVAPDPEAQQGQGGQ